MFIREFHNRASPMTNVLLVKLRIDEHLESVTAPPAKLLLLGNRRRDWRSVADKRVKAALSYCNKIVIRYFSYND